jgi:hypothetical protein
VEAVCESDMEHVEQRDDGAAVDESDEVKLDRDVSVTNVLRVQKLSERCSSGEADEERVFPFVFFGRGEESAAACCC